MESIIIYTDIVNYSEKGIKIQNRLKDLVDRSIYYFLPESIFDRTEGKPYFENTGDGFLLILPADEHDRFPAILSLVFSLTLAAKVIEHGHLIRIGIHCGDVARHYNFMNKEQIRGYDVVIGRRILDTGTNGHILCSTTYKQKLVNEIGHASVNDSGKQIKVNFNSHNLALNDIDLPLIIEKDPIVEYIWYQSHIIIESIGKYRDKHGNLIDLCNIYNKI